MDRDKDHGDALSQWESLSVGADSSLAARAGHDKHLFLNYTVKAKVTE